jgi:DAK2 domain fusion protein YloV
LTASPAFQRCDGPALRRLAEAGLKWLTANQQVINALNVYPIPDGDTGTNMVLTMQAACKEVADRRDQNAGAIAHALAKGAVMGSRGNSGTILSQLWRGFARSISENDSFDAAGMARAMREATDTAYKGVVEPVEGTILTVSKDVAASAEAAAAVSPDLRYMLEQVVKAAHESVARTPDLLPLLKKAGVVDSGGKGLAILLEGMLRHVRGEPVDAAPMAPVQTLDLAAIGELMDSVEPGQEWEVVVDFRPHGELDTPFFYSRLQAMGTSIQVGAGDNLYRVHIHLVKDRRYEPIELAEVLGTVTNVHMENLLDQVGQAPAPPAAGGSKIQPGQIGAVAVAPGPGLARVFEDLSAVVIAGGQTKNPSTEEILQAIDQVTCDRVIVLPNNKNIILAAEQARQLATKQVVVVPTRTVPQGISAMMALTPGGELPEVAQAMAAAAERVQTGEVTTASRTVDLGGVSVQAGQVIGLRNGKLELADGSLEPVVFGLLANMKAAESEFITLYYGESVSGDAAHALAAEVERRYPSAEVSVFEGGQPYYHYIISTE